MKFAEDFRREAREALENNWGKAVGAGFVASLLGEGIVEWRSYSSSFSDAGNATLEKAVSQGGIDSETAALLMAIVGGSLLLGLIMFLVHLLIGSPVTLGYCKFNLNLVDRNGKARFANLFSEFKHLGPAVALQLLRALYTFLWSLLFVIPGIIKGYSYSMAAYILTEHPEMTPNEAITKSRELMDGNKWRLFCLQFSFIGWAFLCLFTCGIGYLWLLPYEEAAVAAFYREIWRNRYGEPEVVKEEIIAEPAGLPKAEETVVEPSSYEAMVQNSNLFKNENSETTDEN